MNFDSPHRRLNPLTHEWVLVSPHRARRPWLGQVEKVPPENLPSYDPNCYLCPGNTRAGGKQNPQYTSTYVFDNDFPALLLPSPGESFSDGPKLPPELFIAEPEAGICRVVCFSPRHDLDPPGLTQSEVEAVIRTWSDQTRDLGSRDFIGYIQVFENKGVMMGCSNPHPHSQIWTSSHVPNEPAKELVAQSDYLQQHDSCLLCDYLKAELKLGERVVFPTSISRPWCPFGLCGLLKSCCSHTAMLPRCPDLSRQRFLAWPTSCVASQHDTITYLRYLSPTRWVSTRHLLTVSPMKPGTCMPIITRLCCAPRPFVSSWSVTRCLPILNAT